MRGGDCISKKQFTIWLVINAILLLIHACILWNIRLGITELNELRTNEYVEEGAVEVQGEEYRIVFGKTSVCVVDSYKITERSERLRIIKAIQNELAVRGISKRQTTSMEGEWLLHNIAYQIIGSRRAKDVDLEYEKDRRWYVALLSEFLALTGL